MNGAKNATLLLTFIVLKYTLFLTIVSFVMIFLQKTAVFNGQRRGFWYKSKCIITLETQKATCELYHVVPVNHHKGCLSTIQFGTGPLQLLHDVLGITTFCSLLVPKKAPQKAAASMNEPVLMSI